MTNERLAASPDGYRLLGVLRFVLATSVVLAHLWNTAFPDAGRNAVAGFFCISGFLITKICNEVYADRPLAFLANRFLRIYPTYWACIALIATTHAFYPAFTVSPEHWVVWPQDLRAWIDQISIINLASGLESTSDRVLIQQAWSLQVELVFYLIIGLATARSFHLTVALVVGSLAYAILGLAGYVPITFYRSVPGSAFMFFLGSLAYFGSLKRIRWKGLTPIGLVLFAVSMYLLPATISEPQNPIHLETLNLFIVLSAIAAFLVLVGLRDSKLGRSIPAGLSDYLGKLSYPVFLIHTSIAVPVALAVESNNAASLFALSYFFTLIFSVLIVELIDKPIEVFRKSIRGRDRRPPADVSKAVQPG